jgi:hypothetical protein
MTPNAAAALLAEGIAIAEGYPNASNVPWRARNPGDLEHGDQGLGRINSITIYPDHATGWHKAILQALDMLTGNSRYYRPTMSLATIAAVYTGAQNAPQWAASVSAHCGISPTDPISKLLTD